MNTAMTALRLREQNRIYRNTRAVSRGCRALGLRPAFQDTATGEVHLSTFADGRPAPVHILDGLPRSWVLAQDDRDRVLAVKETVIAGFLHRGRFYTRGELAADRRLDA